MSGPLHVQLRSISDGDALACRTCGKEPQDAERYAGQCLPLDPIPHNPEQCQCSGDSYCALGGQVEMWRTRTYPTPIKVTYYDPWYIEPTS